MRLRWAVSALVAIALIAVGLILVLPGDEDSAPSPAAAAGRAPRVTVLPDSKVGRVAGTNAYIGLTFDGRRLRVYVCDGTDEHAATIARWFTGGWDGRSPITLKGDLVDLHVDGVEDDGRVRGRVGSHRFTLDPATGPAGLYDGPARPGLHGTWVVLVDRSIRGTFIPTGPPKCRVVAVTSSSGQQQWVTVCSDR
jgi:hypothetical protein